MIFSLTIYILLAFVLFVFALDEKNKSVIGNYNYSTKRSFVVINIITISVLFAIFCGIRYNVGVDNLSYIKEYVYFQNTGKVIRNDFEPLFAFTRNSFAEFGLHYSFFNGFCAFIQIFFVLYALKKERYIYPALVLYIVLSQVFIHWTNGIRQCIATSIFIYLIQYIAEKKFFKYAAGIIICSLIHKSAIILLPLYFIPYGVFKFSLKSSLNVIILLICAILGTNPTWCNILNNLGNVIMSLGYESYETFIDDFSSSKTVIMSWGPGRIGWFLSTVVSVYYYPRMRSGFQLNKRFDIYYCLFFVGCCLFNLLANTSHIFLRPVYYFFDFRIIIVPLCIYMLYKKRKYVVFILLCLFSYFYMPYLTIRAYRLGENENSTDVYKTLFTEDKNFNKDISYIQLID